MRGQFGSAVAGFTKGMAGAGTKAIGTNCHRSFARFANSAFGPSFSLIGGENADRTMCVAVSRDSQIFGS
jgi:hypothetical protein